MKSIPIQLGWRKRFITGGPYMKRPSSMFGVKMANEIVALCDVSIPTEDFSTPNPWELRRGLSRVLWKLAIGKPVYVGCMGGIGRTGLFLAALAKATGIEDPIAYVRSHYNHRAVETTAQEKFVTKLDVTGLRRTVQLAAIVSSLVFWR